MSSEPTEVLGLEKLQAIAGRALVDTPYRRRLLDEPKEVLAEEGLKFSKDTDIVVLQNTRKRIFLVLPPEIGADAGPRPDEVNLQRLVSWLKF